MPLPEMAGPRPLPEVTGVHPLPQMAGPRPLPKMAGGSLEFLCQQTFLSPNTTNCFSLKSEASLYREELERKD